MVRVTENDIAMAVLKIARSRPNGICTLDDARNEVPNHVTLGAADLAESTTRPGEQMWHQLIRNIQSHHEAEGNFINDGLLTHVPGRGYKITKAGEYFLEKQGL
jgi:predicted secreted Zn-dependent protease